MPLITRHTASFCPTCYREIAALVSVSRDGVFMDKTCPVHGPVRSMVERDPVLYTYLLALKAPDIYSGYFIDVTRVCNLRCEYCFYNLEQKDPEGEYSIANLRADCLRHANKAPFIFTGGEATTRKDLPELIDAVNGIGAGLVEIVTNGVRLADKDYFMEIASLLKQENGIVTINLSIHSKETDKWKDVLENARRLGVKLGSALIVIDSKESFHAALKVCAEYQDVVFGWRLKAATNLWNETKAAEKIFVSDMLNWLQELGEAALITQGRNNKTSFLNVFFGGMFLMLVSWYDVGNIDLVDIDCAPYHTARNGETQNFVTSLIINEGMDKGWLKGKEIKP